MKNKKTLTLKMFEYKQYMKERQSYIDEKYKNEFFLDYFITIISVICWFYSLDQKMFHSSIYFGIVLILTVFCSHRAKQAFSEAIDKLDRKDRSENIFVSSLQNFVLAKILFFFAGIISFTIFSL